MNHQDIFNTVATHLMTQGKQARDSSTATSGCRYRGEDGTKCAIGCLIKDEFYMPHFEGHGCGFEPVLDAVEKSLGITMCEHTRFFLSELQCIHDGHVGAWMDSLIKTAEARGLELPEVLK
jgi:hypothetical protein